MARGWALKASLDHLSSFLPYLTACGRFSLLSLCDLIRALLLDFSPSLPLVRVGVWPETYTRCRPSRRNHYPRSGSLSAWCKSIESLSPLQELGVFLALTCLYSPVGLKEAALDSPTFRATTLHFSDQIEFLEKWLDGYAKAASKLSVELAAMEGIVNTFLSYSMNPLVVSEAVLDHDYTLLSMRRSGDSSRDLWNGLVSTTKRIELLVSEPIRVFIQEDLRNFKVN